MDTIQTLVLVTAGHITRGRVGDCEECPIALAVLDAIGRPQGALITVDATFVSLSLPGERREADLPRDAQSFVEDFDSLEGVAPFCFTLTWRSERDPEGLS